MRWETGTAGARSLRTSARYLSALMLLGIAGLAHAQSPAPCSPALGRVVSLQGSVELLRLGSGLWEPLTRLDTPLCRGDRLRAGLLSRAAMYISPETIVRLDQNTTLEVVEQTESETILRFHQDDLTHALAAQSNFCGIGYFITRFPRKLRVRTPFYNAVVEGTEFQVAMTCDRGELAVFEGRVAAESVTASGERVLVEAGQSTSVGIGVTPSAIKALVKPADAVQWALYYLPLTDVSLLTAEALAQDCGQLSAALRSGCVIRRAEYLLRVGRAREARAELADLLALEPNNGDVLALEAIIAVVQNDKEAALDFAQRAVTAAPNAFRPYAAMSYAQQAHFKLDESFDAAKRAAELAPDSALLRARTAELQLSLGRVRSAEREAMEAVRLNPNESRAHLILGFVHLAQIDTKRAAEDFLRAIELDSTEPLARLGLGLATIREGRLQEGREHIEIAVALDPTNSLVRSYVGKAYYEENTTERDRLAATQFGLGKALDPNDPTPWFYDAILKQTQNRPVEALEDLKEATQLNDNKAVYRSTFMLDDDAASRRSQAANVYRDLGFERLSLLESAVGLMRNFANYSAHESLSEVYTSIPRHDISRASEALQAQIRRPLSMPRVNHLVDADNILILPEVNPRSSSYDYSALYDRQQLAITLDAVTGTRGTWGDQIGFTGLGEQVAFAFGQLHYETDGFEDNDLARKDIYSAMVHIQGSPRTSLQGELRSSRFKVGQTFFAFDDAFATPTNILEDSDSLRFSGLIDLEALGDFVLTIASEERYREVTSHPDGALFTDSSASAFSLEAQSVFRRGSVQLISGVGFATLTEDFLLEAIDVQSEASNFYSNAVWSLQSNLSVQLGLSADHFRISNSGTSSETKTKFLPKIGFIWSPVHGAVIRAALTHSLKRPLIRSQTLEPTQIAGFNQFYTGFEQFYGDFPGTLSKRIGVAVDSSVLRGTHVGIEASRREITIPVLTLQRNEEWKEHTANAYVYSVVGPFIVPGVPKKASLAFSAEVEAEDVERSDSLTGPEGILQLETLRVPLSARLFWGAASIKLGATYVNQEGDFTPDPVLPITRVHDRGWILDSLYEVLLPTRRGAIAVGVKNVLDEQLTLLEIDPLNPRIATRRLLFARVNLRF